MTNEEAIQTLKEIQSGARTLMLTVGSVELENGLLRDCQALGMAIEALEKAPKKGRWISDYDGYYDLTLFKCSECEHEWCFEVEEDIFDLDYNYCPNCGAYMRGENDE